MHRKAPEGVVHQSRLPEYIRIVFVSITASQRTDIQSKTQRRRRKDVLNFCENAEMVLLLSYCQYL